MATYKKFTGYKIAKDIWGELKIIEGLVLSQYNIDTKFFPTEGELLIPKGDEIIITERNVGSYTHGERVYTISLLSNPDIGLDYNGNKEFDYTHAYELIKTKGRECDATGAFPMVRI